MNRDKYEWIIELYIYMIEPLGGNNIVLFYLDNFAPMLVCKWDLRGKLAG